MLFNSIEFGLFLPIVFFLYWFVLNRNIRQQNRLIIFASYLFYGWWDWRFLLLIIFSSGIDYIVGLQLFQSKDRRARRAFLVVSLIVNLGVLGFFKYYNFFIEQFANAFTLAGFKPNIQSLNIILPVGISFYTFQTLSYTIDIFRKRLEPTRDWTVFFAYVSFFPQLVAGPIERATNLIPQFSNSRQFNLENAKDGMRQILWGLFKKIVVADNCALVVNEIFSGHDEVSASILVVGVIFFAFQIYGDFSGYSDIAIGVARLFGFSLMKNFAYPYFSRDIAEFWRRWHISLSTWFRDYLYIPMGGSRVSGKFLLIRNVMVIFVISGFWHGANWTFIVWGALNGLFFLPSILMGRNRRNLNLVGQGKVLPSFVELLKMLSTFLLVCLTWVFFRAENLNHAFEYLYYMVDVSILDIDSILKYVDVFPWIILLILIEWLQRSKNHALEIQNLSVYMRWTIYYVLVLIIFYKQPKDVIDFIYFQF